MVVCFATQRTMETIVNAAMLSGGRGGEVVKERCQRRNLRSLTPS